MIYLKCFVSNPGPIYIAKVADFTEYFEYGQEFGFDVKIFQLNSTYQSRHSVLLQFYYMIFPA